MNNLHSLLNVPQLQIEEVISRLYKEKSFAFRYDNDYKHHFNLSSVHDFTLYFIKYFEQALSFNFVDKKVHKFLVGPDLSDNIKFKEHLASLYEDPKHLIALEKFLLSFLELSSQEYSEHSFQVLQLFFPEDIYIYDEIQKTSLNLRDRYIKDKNLTPIFIHFMNSLNQDQRGSFYNLYGLIFHE